MVQYDLIWASMGQYSRVQHMNIIDYERSMAEYGRVWSNMAKYIAV